MSIFPFIVIAQVGTFASPFNTEIDFTNLEDTKSVTCSIQPAFKSGYSIFTSRKNVDEFVKAAKNIKNDWYKQVTIAGKPPLCGFNAINIDYYNTEVKKFHNELIHDPESRINRVTIYESSNQKYGSCKYEGENTYFRGIDASDYNHIKNLCGI